ncbi:MAG: GNAT family N-acetyltransferase [Alphaproteobacteria bacterium]|nr:GNAT family N-acetyltransferase [Alphaproteobacteria bacterium]
MTAFNIDDITFELRPAKREDFDFAWLLYQDLMEPLTVELIGRWNEVGQIMVVKEAMIHEGTAVITLAGVDIGWLQVIESKRAIYLGQIYIHPDIQNHGIGTAILHDLIERAQREGKTLTLDVMRNNRARALYERLGFRTVSETAHKFTMEWREPAD